VEQVAYFEVDNAQRKSLTYSVKQMLAREIELEKLRQYECNLGPMITPKATIEEIEEEPKVIKPPPNAAMTLALKPKPIVESCKVSPLFLKIYYKYQTNELFRNPIDESFSPLLWEKGKSGKKVVLSD
jgi:hypothetical protein